MQIISLQANMFRRTGRIFDSSTKQLKDSSHRNKDSLIVYSISCCSKLELYSISQIDLN